MSTTYHYFTGITKWAKVRKPDNKYNNFQVPLYMTPDVLKEFKVLGLGLKIKEDSEGSLVTFKRPMEKLIKGEVVHFGPPKVFNPDGTEMTEGLIGNGSTVTVKIQKYDTLKGPGHRLESVRVDNLVEYNPPKEDTTGSSVRPNLPF